MALLVAQVVARARGLMQDEKLPVRYTDSQLYDAINDGVQEMNRLRSDLFILHDFDPPPVGGMGDTIPVPDRHILALVYFAVGFLMLREDEFANDGRAAQMLGAAQAHMGMGK